MNLRYLYNHHKNTVTIQAELMGYLLPLANHLQKQQRRNQTRAHGAPPNGRLRPRRKLELAALQNPGLQQIPSHQPRRLAATERKNRRNPKHPLQIRKPKNENRPSHPRRY